VRCITLRLGLVLLALTLVATSAEAQRRRRAVSTAPAPSYGAHLGYNFDNGGNFLLGAQLTYPITPRVGFYASFDNYFVSPGSLWALNADLKVRPPTRGGFLYLGGGLNYSHASVNGTGSGDTGLNLFGGLEGRRSRGAIPYVEAKLIVSGGSSFQLVGGFSWR
jgi:hypothetical protein